MLDHFHQEHPQLSLPDNYIETALNQNNETIIADFDKTTETFDIDDIDLSQIPSKCPCCKKSTQMYKALGKRIQSNLFPKHVLYWKNTITQTFNNLFQEFLEVRITLSDQDKLTYLKNTCKKLEEAGIISVIHQPVYTSNIVLVPKYKTFRNNFKASSIGKNKEVKEVASYHLTQDLRGLNYKTISTARTITVDQEAFINRLSNKLLTSLDMTSAYFQIKLSEESKPLTFVCRYSHILFAEDVTGFGKCAEELCHHVEHGLRRQGPQQDHDQSIAVTEFSILGLKIDTAQAETFLDYNKASSILSWPRLSLLFETQSRL